MRIKEIYILSKFCISCQNLQKIYLPVPPILDQFLIDSISLIQYSIIASEQIQHSLLQFHMSYMYVYM